MGKSIKGLAIITSIIALARVLTIKNIQITEYCTQVTFRDNKGYYIEK